MCLLVALGGAAYFTKINVMLFFFLCLGIIIAVLAIFFRGTFTLRGRSDEGYKHYKWSASRFEDNWDTDCDDQTWSSSCKSFEAVFGVLFPAFTGIMEGANLSGDLANPSRSIPLGTLAAQGTSIVVYLLTIIACAGSYSAYVLIKDYTILQETAWGEVGYYLVILAILISTPSSGLGALFGGSRILQAIARDKIFPYLDIFGYGRQKGDEPIIGVVFTWFVAQCLLFIGNLDSIATLSTCFFCLCYATVNFSCFLLEVSGTPNFRPQFRYYSKYTALFGLVSNLFVMFYVSYKFGSAALICMGAIFAFLTFVNLPNKSQGWGDVTQSVMFHQVRKYLLRLDERKLNVNSKSWRLSILLFVNNNDLGLIDFCNVLKKGGLYLVGSVIKQDFAQSGKLVKKIKHEWIEFCSDNHIKAFPQISAAVGGGGDEDDRKSKDDDDRYLKHVRDGYENLLLLSGLGAMQPNTVVMPLVQANNKTIGELTARMSSVGDVSGARDGDDGDDGDVKTGQGKKKKKKGQSKISVPDEEMEEDSKEEEVDENEMLLFSKMTEKERELIVESPEILNYNQYMKMLYNILKFEKNLVLTHNFDQLDTALIGSEQIQKFIKRHPDRYNNPSNIAKIPNINLYFNSVVSLDSNFKYWVDVWLFSDDYSFDINLNDDDDGVSGGGNVEMSRNENENGNGNGNGGLNEYDNDFPMLMMQLAHLILLNRKWGSIAKLRIFIVIKEDEEWNNSKQKRFDDILKELRLSVDKCVILKRPKPGQVGTGNVNNGNGDNDGAGISGNNNMMETSDRPSWDNVISGKTSENEMILYYKQINNMIRRISGKTLFLFLRLPRLPPISRMKQNNKMISKLNQLYFTCLYVLLNNLPSCALVATGESVPVISVDI